MRPSYCFNGKPCAGKTMSLQRDGPQGHMCQWTLPFLVQIMASRLFGGNTLSQSMTFFSIRPQGTYFNETLFEIQTFSLKNMHMKMSYGKWRPSCLDLYVLIAVCCKNHKNVVLCGPLTKIPTYEGGEIPAQTCLTRNWDFFNGTEYTHCAASMSLGQGGKRCISFQVRLSNLSYD